MINFFHSMGKMIRRLDAGIEITFYALFFATPLAMHAHTNELFEFNKMWLVFIFSLVIFFLWGAKMILNRKFEIRRTPFDIPLLLFLLSQIVSTLFSLDRHTSLWGYYSRFNGGLFSTISYIFLYYAFATNLIPKEKEETENKFNIWLILAGCFSFIIGTFYASKLIQSDTLKSDAPQTLTLLLTLAVSFVFFHLAYRLDPVKKAFAFIFTSGAIVALWGLPSHFGLDPTCLLFRGSLDVACWTEAFQPKIRMFSTLGQPNWLAAFLAILIFMLFPFAINEFKKVKKIELNKAMINSALLVLLLFSFYVDMVWTLSQSGFIGFWGANILFTSIFAFLIIRKNNFSKALRQRSFQILLFVNFLFLITTFFTTNPIPSLQRFQFSHLISSRVAKPAATNPISTTQATTTPPAAGPSLETNITGSSKIRAIVWKGAINVFKKNPLFGSGVETFAFAYYQNRPIEHNLTSEWDYLYNKAHNEFLNYLATTGIFGFGTYMFFIILFLWFIAKEIFRNFNKRTVGNPLPLAFAAAFVSIMISNFFGFSVVIVNLLFFLIPVFYFAMSKSATDAKIKYFTFANKATENHLLEDSVKPGQSFGIIGLGLVSVFCILFLVNYWLADKEYAMGYNLNRVNEYESANQFLEKAVAMQGGEDLYKNELSFNLSSLAYESAQKNDATHAAMYGQRAKDLSDEVALRNPNNVVYFKTRTRVLLYLSQIQPSILPEALDSVMTASRLAPTDAKILYNKALILNQGNKKEEAIQVLDETIRIKNDYRDAYYAQALFYSQLIDDVKKKDPQKAEDYRKKATERLEYSLKNILADDKPSLELLKTLNP